MGESRYLSCAETAKLVREALKAEFPSVKFSVRSKTYSGGASITVYWTDGPVAADVERVTALYSGASFDGMIDLKSYHSSILAGPDGVEEVHFGADYIFTSRHLSDEFRARLEAIIERVSGEPFDGNRHYALATCRDWPGELARDEHRGEYGSTLVYQMSAMIPA